MCVNFYPYTIYCYYKTFLLFVQQYIKIFYCIINPATKKREKAIEKEGKL